eukprot:s452_g12.t1
MNGGSALRITLATLESAIAENGRSGDDKFPTFVQLADAQLVDFWMFLGSILKFEWEKSEEKPETMVLNAPKWNDGAMLRYAWWFESIVFEQSKRNNTYCMFGDEKSVILLLKFAGIRKLLKVFVHETVQQFAGFSDEDSTHQFFQEQQRAFMRDTVPQFFGLDDDKPEICMSHDEMAHLSVVFAGFNRTTALLRRPAWGWRRKCAAYDPSEPLGSIAWQLGASGEASGVPQPFLQQPREAPAEVRHSGGHQGGDTRRSTGRGLQRRRLWWLPASTQGPMAGLLEDDGVLSPFMAIIAVLKGIVGLCAFALPAALAKTNLVLGIVLLVVVAVAEGLGTYRLAECSMRLERSGKQVDSAQGLGPLGQVSGYRLCFINVMFAQFGLSCAYTRTVANTLQQIWDMPSLELYVSSIEKMRGVALLSMLALGAFLCIVLCVLRFGLERIEAGDAVFEDVWLPIHWWGTGACMGPAISAFEGPEIKR